ncbi:MAG: hypothetical protein ACKO85_03355 [Isosphaeraceae bacterium]
MQFQRLAGLVLGSLMLSGCGGTTPLDNAVVVPDPALKPIGGSASAPAATSVAPAAAPAAATPTAAAPAAGPATTPTASDGFGTLKGKVVLEGGKPTIKFLVAKGDGGVKDANVCASDNIVNEVLEIDDATKGVKNVLVYIPKPSAVNPDAVKAAQAAKIVFDQKNCVFKPHVVAFMKGQTLDIVSSDPVGHNVNAKMRANGASNNLLSPGQKTTFSPKAAEGRPSEVTCDIHPWMKAYWLILDNPYFAVTNEKGEFEIKMAPAGTQKVVVWQESVQFVTPAVGQDVNIAKDGVTEANFQVSAAKAKIN